ncbi:MULTISPECIES: hypothetical protein [Planktothricoides]|nr:MULTISPECIES: hypothetical protein [Planktothricoides]
MTSLTSSNPTAIFSASQPEISVGAKHSGSVGANGHSPLQY